MTCPAIDCSNRSHIPDVDLDANGDIAGPGVIIGFVGNAYFALLILFLYYMVSFDPYAHPFGLLDANVDTETSVKQADWWKPSPADTWLLDVIRRNARRAVKALGLDVILLHDAKKLEPRFVTSIIHMCDLQLLTGFAILISAYIEVPCTMSAYHWQIVVHLAWFSSITHLTGLVAARRYLHGRIWARFGRIAASILFLVMLLVAIAPTMYFNWDTIDGQIGATDMSSSVACLYDPAIGPAVWEYRGQEAWEECIDVVEARVAELYEEYPDLDEMMANGTASDVGIADETLVMVQQGSRASCWTTRPLPATSSASFQAVLYSVILLGWAFLSRFVRLWVPLFRFLTLRIGRPLASLIQRLVRRLEGRSKKNKSVQDVCVNGGGPSRGISYYLINRPLLGWLIFVRINMDCITSMFGELTWLSILIVWGTLRLISTISFARDSGRVDGEQDWNFGQTLPVLLLIGPLLMVVRSFTTTRVKQDPRRAWQEDQQQGRLSRETTLHQHHSFLEHEPTITRRTSSELVEQTRVRDQYKSSTWMGGCLVASFVHFIIMVAMSFGSAMELQAAYQGMSESTFMIWIYSLQLLVYIFVYYPLASHLSILAGLLHDDICSGHNGSLRSESSNSSSSDGGSIENKVAPTCGHTKWMALLTFFLTGLFPSLLWVCQLKSVYIPGIDGSIRVFVLGISVAAALYISESVVVLCCTRSKRRRKRI